MKKRKQQSTAPLLILIAGGALLLFAAVLFMQQNGARQTTAQPSAVSDHEDTYAEIQRVSLTEAKGALDAGTAVFVDVRAAEVYAVAHIPGSLSIPSAELEMRLGELDPNAWIITYCT